MTELQRERKYWPGLSRGEAREEAEVASARIAELEAVLALAENCDHTHTQEVLDEIRKALMR